MKGILDRVVVVVSYPDKNGNKMNSRLNYFSMSSLKSALDLLAHAHELGFWSSLLFWVTFRKIGVGVYAYR